MPVSNATVAFDGTQQGSAVTNSSGNYSLTVASGGVYTLMPSKYGFGFTPPSRMVPYISGNETVNFASFDANATVSGRVVGLDGRGVNSAIVNIVDAGGNVVAQTYSNSFGYYILWTIAIDQTYIVSALRKGRTFDSRTIYVFEDIGGFDFVEQP